MTKKLPSGKGHYQIRMIPYQDAGFRYPLSGSHIKVEIDQQIYVAVQVDGVDGHQISTVLDSCWATPVNDPSYAVRWNLIAREYGNIMFTREMLACSEPQIVPMLGIRDLKV